MLSPDKQSNLFEFHALVPRETKPDIVLFPAQNKYTKAPDPNP